MTITRVGSNAAYADGWSEAFGGAKQTKKTTKSAVKATKKTTVKAKKKPAKKTKK